MPNAQGDRKSFRGGRQLSALYKEMLPGQRCTHTHTHHTLHASAKQNFLGQIQTAPLISSSCGVGFLSHLSPHLPFGTLIPLFQGYPRIGKKKKKTHIFDAQEGVGIMIIFTLTVTLTNKVGLSDTFGKE